MYLPTPDLPYSIVFVMSTQFAGPTTYSNQGLLEKSEHVESRSRGDRSAGVCVCVNSAFMARCELELSSTV
jgi:hypothetical protein